MARHRETCDLLHDMMAASNNFFEVGYYQMEQVLDDIFDIGKRSGSIYAYSRITETSYILRIMFSFETNFHYFSFRNGQFILNFKLDMRNPNNFARNWYNRLCDYYELLRRAIDAEADRIAENEAMLIRDLQIMQQIPVVGENGEIQDPFGLLQETDDE